MLLRDPLPMEPMVSRAGPSDQWPSVQLPFNQLNASQTVLSPKTPEGWRTGSAVL
jgi:hypothetical protein